MCKKDKFVRNIISILIFFFFVISITNLVLFLHLLVLNQKSVSCVREKLRIELL